MAPDPQKIPAQPAAPTDEGAAKAFDDELSALWTWNLTNHKPTPEALNKIEALRSTAIALKDAIIALSPHSRERSLALTNLEQTVFYSVAAVARTEVEEAKDDTPDEDKALNEQSKKEKESKS